MYKRLPFTLGNTIQASMKTKIKEVINTHLIFLYLSQKKDNTYVPVKPKMFEVARIVPMSVVLTFLYER